MRAKKFFGIAFMTLALFVGFTACSNDDDLGSDEEIAADLVGTWEAGDYDGWWYEEDGKKHSEKGKYDKDELVYEIDKDGNGTEIWDQEYEYSFKWSVKNQILTLKFNSYTEEYTISSLSSKKLVLVESGKDEDGEYRYTVTLNRK